MVSQAIKGAAMAEPTLLPLLAIPIARDCIFLGTHIEIALANAGQLPPSPMPSNTRKKPRLKAPRAKACRQLATDHQMTESDRPRRTPSLSITQPPTPYMMV